MENDTKKILSVAAIIFTMVVLSIAKCIFPNLEVTLLNSTLLQLLVSIGVLHANQQNSKEPK